MWENDSGSIDCLLPLGELGVAAYDGATTFSDIPGTLELLRARVRTVDRESDTAAIFTRSKTAHWQHDILIAGS
jgi:hypothetical protein